MRNLFILFKWPNDLPINKKDIKKCQYCSILKMNENEIVQNYSVFNFNLRLKIGSKGIGRAVHKNHSGSN